jgi:SAM-dependent methyltransferase
VPGALRRAAFAGLHHAGRTFQRVATVCGYAAAGTLTLAELHAGIRRQWERDSACETERQLTSGLLVWERELYLRFLEPGARVFLVGCGNGRDLLALLQHGFRVAGLDLAPGAIATARRLLERHGLTADLAVGSIETAPLPDRCGAIVFAWGCYGYVPQSDRRVAMLRRASGHLAPGGRILLSYYAWQRPPRRLPIGLTRLVARVSGSDWTPEYGDHLSTDDPDGLLYFEHRFLPGEIERETRAAGLALHYHDPADGLAVLVSA